MLVENDWITTNISERLTDRNCKIVTRVKSYNFTPSSFMDAAVEVVNKIKHYNLYLGLSGGADSDFVCRLLHRECVKFTPIIAVTSGNALERQYAFHTCKELSLEPVVFELSDKQVMEIYATRIVKPLGGIGLYTAQNIIISDYIKERNGKFLTGVNVIGGTENNRAYIGMYEFDFYSDVLYGNDFEIPFNLYTPKIVYETINRMSDDMDEAETKYQLYELTDFRPKLQYKYDEKIGKIYSVLHKNFKLNEVQYIWKNLSKEYVKKMLTDFDNEYVV